MAAFLRSLKPAASSDHDICRTIQEKELVDGLKNNNKQAINQLYKMYAGALFGIISNIVKFDEIAEDVLQDTFLKIWKSIHTYDETKGRLFTWMANIAKNMAIDQVRSKNYTKGNKTDNIANLAIEVLDHRNNTKFNPDNIGLKQLIKGLKKDHQHILDLIYYKGYTHVEVAELLSIPLGTVKTKIRLSIIALRKYFN